MKWAGLCGTHIMQMCNPFIRLLLSRQVNSLAHFGELVIGMNVHSQVS